MTSNVKNESQRGKSTMLPGPCLFTKRFSNSAINTSIVPSTIGSYVDTVVILKEGLRAFLTFLCHIGSTLENKVCICSPLETDALTKYISDLTG